MRHLRRRRNLNCFAGVSFYGYVCLLYTSNITGSVTWSVSNPNVATISTTGLATAVGAGYTQVMAESGGITATSDMTVTIPGSTSGTTGSTIVSLAIIPGSQSVASPTQTTQFLAIGTTSSATTVNLTGQVAWSSSSTQIATIGVATGLATAVGQGSTTITAIYTNSTGGTVVAGTATFTVTGGTTEKYTAVAITPGTQGLSASGQTGQFIALGTSGTTGLETDVTNSAQIKWSSSIPSIASVNATGLATGLSVGTTTITAELTNADGSVVSNTASVAVSATAAPEPLLSLTIVPASITAVSYTHLDVYKRQDLIRAAQQNHPDQDTCLRKHARRDEPIAAVVALAADHDNLFRSRKPAQAEAGDRRPGVLHQGEQRHAELLRRAPVGGCHLRCGENLHLSLLRESRRQRQIVPTQPVPARKLRATPCLEHGFSGV